MIVNVPPIYDIGDQVTILLIWTFLLGACVWIWAKAIVAIRDAFNWWPD